MSENDDDKLFGWCDSEFWKLDCLSSLLILPNLIMWLFWCIPLLSHLWSNEDDKKWWSNPFLLRYLVLWIVIISVAIAESNYSTIQLCQCMCVFCFIRIFVYFYIFFVWFWFLYNHESIYKVEYQYFKNVFTLSQAQDYLMKLHMTNPRITFTAQNFVMETVHTHDGQYEQRKDTFRFEQTHLYNHKVSEEWKNLSIDGTTRVKLTKGFVFDYDALKYDHYAKYHEFKQRSRVRNHHMDAKEEIHIPDFVERILVIPDGCDLLFWLNKTYFWMSTFFFLSLPYQWLFKWRTKNTKYHIEKSLVSLETYN